MARAGRPRGRTTTPAAPPPAHLCRIDTNAFDPLLFKTYGDISADARSNHKCQGMGGVPAQPGFAAAGLSGEENADRCAWTYGSTFAVGPARANLTLGSRHFLIQANWINTPSGGCVLSAAQP